MTRHRIAVIGTGSTISSVSRDSLGTLNCPEFGTKLTGPGVPERLPEMPRETRPVRMCLCYLRDIGIVPGEGFSPRKARAIPVLALVRAAPSKRIARVSRPQAIHRSRPLRRLHPDA